MAVKSTVCEPITNLDPEAKVDETVGVPWLSTAVTFHVTAASGSPGSLSTVIVLSQYRNVGGVSSVMQEIIKRISFISLISL